MPQDRLDIAIGEAVKVVIDGATVTGNAPLVVAAGADQVTVPADATVNLVKPAGWPPEPGDVWLDKTGKPWAAILSGSPLEVRMFPHSGGAAITPNRFSTDYRPVSRAYRATIPA